WRRRVGCRQRSTTIVSWVRHDNTNRAAATSARRNGIAIVVPTALYDESLPTMKIDLEPRFEAARQFASRLQSGIPIEAGLALAADGGPPAAGFARRLRRQQRARRRRRSE